MGYMNDISKHPNIGVHIMELQPPYCKRLRSWSGNSEHPAENLMAAFGEPRFQLEQNGVPFFATDQVEGADSQKGMPFQCDVIMISWHTSFNPKLTYLNNPTIQEFINDPSKLPQTQRINRHKPTEIPPDFHHFPRINRAKWLLLQPWNVFAGNLLGWPPAMVAMGIKKSLHPGKLRMS